MRRIFFFLAAVLAIALTADAKPKKLTSTLKWDVTPEGVLQITGHGDMPDWPAPQNEAWYKDGKWHKINKIEIGEGVTSIGFKSFSPTGNEFARTQPVQLSLPSTLVAIGDFSFKNTPISNLELPDRLKRIGLGAFTAALKQDSLVFPASMTTVADGAFMRCQLQSVAFHSDVVVGPGAFFECRPLTDIWFNGTWTELAPGAFEGNHRLAELHDFDNVRMPGGNPFIRTPLERNQDVLALMGVPQAPAAGAGDNAMAAAEEGSEAGFISELDFNIPVMDGIDRDNTFCLVIGNENYTREAKVPFANNDAEVFSLYLKKTLGIPSKNVHLIKDASLNDMRFGMNLLAKTSNAYEGNINIIVYYAGHGVPDEATRDAFLLPVDGYGADTSTGYSIAQLYDRLGNIPSRGTVVFMDACFSGAKREGEMMASARGVAIAPKKAETKGNMVVFTAATGEETAYAYNEEGHGMFTYFLLKKLQTEMGDVTLGDLCDYITSNVKQHAIRENQKSQTPTVNVPASMGEDWRNIKL
ncbi:MAG: leucine-rich repeat protein [Muribaculaceae bacterium]|nr:leucine-rich repeat protein [Muribaculaceae bacterium]MDE5956891.1 leucine-rich repeat protein [Muribaculaceae bacterium]MDE6447707.1 leucine-rich repeat protein [Muribaculaceae bacterium]